jgi:hypothetical protein
MSTYERRLIGPAPDELGRALLEAAAAADRGCRTCLAGWTPASVPGLLAPLHESPEGWRQWFAGPRPYRTNQARSAVVVAWWTDSVGRRHYRVASRRGAFSREYLDDHLTFLGRPAPPLALIHPEHTFHLVRSGTRTLLALCGCGAAGRPAELGWMGDCCGPCHDRRLEGVEVPRPWPDPAAATLTAENPLRRFLGFSPDGRLLALGANRRTVAVLEADTLRPLARVLTPGQGMVCAAVFDPEGRTLTTARSCGLVTAWELPSGKPGTTLSETSDVSDLVATPDGSLLVRADRRGVTVWERATGELYRDYRGRSGGQCARLAVSPVGTVLAGTDRHGGVTVWDWETGEDRGHVDLPLGVYVPCIAFSPDGRTLAVPIGPHSKAQPTPPPGRVLLWDVAVRQVRTILKGHPGGAFGASFSPDGRTLATGGLEGLIKFWDTAANAERAALEWGTGGVVPAAFSPDGRWLATSGAGSVVKLWHWEVLERLAR